MRTAIKLAAVLVSLAVSWSQNVPRKTAMNPEWNQVDRLVSEQKFEEAAALAAKIRVAAQKSGDDQEWTRALAREVQLRTALHGYETAVALLKGQPWPDGALNRAVLNLIYARSLTNYYHGYSWDVNRRERVASASPADLKTWTRDQIFEEAQKAYAEMWKGRTEFGSQPIERMGEYVEKNNYPEKIRGTLRDAVSYLYVELLGDTSFWRPEESNELYLLDLEALLSAGSRDSVTPLDNSVHPLRKIASILQDLESWHADNGRPAAALEARLELLRRLHASFTEPEARTAILADLGRALARTRGVSWWAAGKAVQAEFVRDQDRPGKLVRARAIAEEGWKAFPDSVGGRRCLSIMRTIEAPQFDVHSMSADGPGKRSLEVVHANVGTLYFRAYSYDLENRLTTARDYNLLPNMQEQEQILGSRKPAVEWRVDLPGTPDYESHRTFVTPPLKSPGFYVLFTSANPSFSRPRNRLLATTLLISDLVLVSSYDGDSVEVRTLSGATGSPVAGAEVDLWRFDWQNGHQRTQTQQSDSQGVVRFAGSAGWQARYFLYAKHGGNLALDPESMYMYTPERRTNTPVALVYTDRSVYRPLQKVLWKVLAYGGDHAAGRYRTLASQPVSVSLLDANGEVLETRTATTNTFGSAAGEFSLPAGRLLGMWHIRTSPSGAAQIRVEEYKRPTFEVTLKDPEGALRLNRPAKFTGEARYYFGLPVVNGKVNWRATREPVYPFWWFWYGPEGGFATQSQTVGAGSSPLREDGTFTVEFTPGADERKAAESRDITYRYRITADVTDEGGETRSASRAFRLGFISVEARIDASSAFQRERTPAAVTITRTDLNGVARPGTGSWRLVSLRQPAVAVPPADLPLNRPATPARSEGYRTPGDGLRSRWDTDFSWKGVLRGWPEGSEQARGLLKHDERGQATASLPALAAGPYRLEYETVDDFGERYRLSDDFVVAGSRTPLALPAVLIVEKTSVRVGDTARFVIHSGLQHQPLFLDVFRDGHFAERHRFTAGQDASVFEIPVRESDRGGFSVRLLSVADHQFMHFEQSVFVPWDNKELKLEFGTFRDKLRPGTRETWRVTVKGPAGAGVEANAAEVLAYMYDRSLDIFAPHHPPSVPGVYPTRTAIAQVRASLGQSAGNLISEQLSQVPPYPELRGDRLKFDDGYGIGGPGKRYRRGVVFGAVGGVAPSAVPAPVMADRGLALEEKVMVQEAAPSRNDAQAAPTEAAVPLRSDFAETAFWRPQLLTDDTGSATIEFTVPDSVTSWNVWVHAVTRDLQGASLQCEARSVKELMVRPYLPRFLREGDKAELKVVINNASEREFSGKVTLDILDPENQTSVIDQFGLGSANAQPFTVRPGGGANVTFPIVTPVKVGTVAFKVTAVSGDVSDGELRPLPVLPGRMHLSQSRFVSLKDKDRREMTFPELQKSTDPTLVNEQLVVTVDAQLFYSVLSALPYLVTFPYECTEQTLNRFVSTGILTSLYDSYPAVARMAQEFSRRETPLETWDSADPNRKMGLEETPWLQESRGGRDSDGMLNVLDPRIARAERVAALAKLRKSQTANGAFPWWAGGPPSPYMTLYLMYGFAKAAEFGVDVPKDMVQRGWGYLAQHFREEYASKMLKQDCCWEWLTFLNYTASCYPDPSWMGSALTARERTDILNHSFKHWKEHSPYLKSQLALTLKRMGRPRDAELVFASVMDSARTSRDEGTYWAPEDRAWLWYNDRIETHAFALRTLTELMPEDPRKDGLVHWLFLNKKLNHWKSTRATAEVIYSLVHYLRREGALGTREDATVRVGGEMVHYVFEPDQYTGKKNQTVIPGGKIDASYATIAVEKESKGLLFASATWQFSTDRLPAEESGDFLFVKRTYFLRVHDGRDFTLKPLAEGAVLQPGDQLEVQLSIRARHPFEYVHLRDPRAAGLEPENAVSRFRWDSGIGWYEETRDSGTNFFFEWLPQGEYTLRYRLRANLAGTFKVGPATLQSMYAPEFTAYSAGAVIRIR